MQLCPTAHPTVRSSIPLHCFLLRPCRPSSLHRKQVDSMVVTTRVSSLATTSQPTQAPLRPRQASQGHAPRCICKPVQASQHPSTAATTEDANLGGRTDRRALLLGGSALVLSPAVAPPANAIQGLTAGRIPGLSTEADASGFYTYKRPEGKSGGHGVGWSEIPRYEFKVPDTWDEIPVSIADLGGTEIDLRYQSKEQGDVAIVVAPILRFRDVGFNAQVTIEELGEPEKIIKGFAPELFGNPVEDEDIKEVKVDKRGGLTYYNFAVKGNKLVSMTAYGNRVFIMSIAASSRQWRKHEDTLRKIASTFKVVEL